MAPKVDPVTPSEDFPTSTKVVVIGGGIVGVSAAFFLAKAGIPVALCEKGHIAGEQSSRNWGWTRVMGRDEKEIPLGQASLALWRQMNELTGRETGFRQCGILYACDDQRALDEFLQWKDIANTYQVETRTLTGAQVADRLPGTQRMFRGGLYSPTDGRAEPTKAAPAIANAARDLGAAILTNCAVRGIETKGGRVCGVVTERGTIACESVILAGGAWSRLFSGNMGIDLPALKVLGSVARVIGVTGAPSENVGGSDFAFRRMIDGSYNIARRNASVADIVPDSFLQMGRFAGSLKSGWKELRFRVGHRFVEEMRMPKKWALDGQSPFELIRTLDPEPSHKLLEQAKKTIMRDFPAFRTMQEVERWGGLIDVSPDAVPVIGPLDQVPGFFFAAGLSGHGFGIGPGAGKLIADMVAGIATAVDPTPFSFNRFSQKVRKAA